jgi:hypothetical protein
MGARCTAFPIHGGRYGMEEKERATRFQIEQATELINQGGSDPEWYDLDKMSRGQISRLIDELKDEWEG